MKRILWLASFLTFLLQFTATRPSLAQEMENLPPVCGNGRVEFGEECDGGFGCSTECKLLDLGLTDPPTPVYTIVNKPPRIELTVDEPKPKEPPVVLEGCGDGIVQEYLGETCDDGNTVDGDGCDSTCHIVLPPPVKYDPPTDPSDEIPPPKQTTPESPAAPGSGATPTNDSAPGETGHSDNGRYYLDGGASMGCSMGAAAMPFSTDSFGMILMAALFGIPSLRRKK